MKTYTVKFSKGQSEIVGENQADAEQYAQTVAKSQGLTVESVIEKVENSGRHDKGFCHYCGMDAVNWGFFSEPVCKGCS